MTEKETYTERDRRMFLAGVEGVYLLHERAQDPIPEEHAKKLLWASFSGNEAELIKWIEEQRGQ